MTIDLDLCAFKPARRGPYKARSASDRTDNWPFWYVEGGDGVNALSGADGAVLTTRGVAILLADEWNSKGVDNGC